MEWLDSRITPTDIIRNYDTSKFYDGESKISSPGKTDMTNLPEWLSTQSDSDRRTSAAESGNILLVPRDGKRRGISLPNLINVAERWNVAPPIFRALKPSSSSSAGTTPKVSCAATTRDGITWHYYPIPIYWSDRGVMRYRIVEVVFGVRHDSQHSQHSSPPLPAFNTLVFCPSTFVNEVENAMLKSVGIGGGGSPTTAPQLTMLRFLVLLFEAIIQKWAKLCSNWDMAVSSQAAALLGARQHLLTADPLVEADSLLMDVRRIHDALEGIHRLLTHLAEVVSSNLTVCEEEDVLFQNIIQAIKKQSNTCLELQRRGTQLHTNHRSVIDKLHAMIALNNTTYLRSNTIAHRRLAELNRQETAEIQRLNRQFLRDSRDMRRLAYLTMAFLPSTFVATFFSTPFMSLDDNLSFKASRKIWIYFLVSGIMTLVTFTVSIVWDKIHLQRQSQGQKRKNEAEEDEDSAKLAPTEDRNILEPQPSPKSDYKKVVEYLERFVRDDDE